MESAFRQITQLSGSILRLVKTLAGIQLSSMTTLLHLQRRQINDLTLLREHLYDGISLRLLTSKQILTFK